MIASSVKIVRTFIYTYFNISPRQETSDKKILTRNPDRRLPDNPC